jgi:hypothetical protein
MTAPLIIVGGPMRAELTRGEFPHALAEQAPDLAVYQRIPIPGRVVANAFDWVAVLGTTADLLAVAGAIWAIYSKIRSSKTKSEQAGPPGLFIQVKNAQHGFVQVVIDENTTEEVFVEEFRTKVSILRETSGDERNEATFEEYENTKYFKRVQKRKDA